MHALTIRGRCTRRPIVAPGGPVVSLTSFDPRVRLVHLTIESIARGQSLPSRVVLWLDELDHVAFPLPALRRLQRRGLEIRHCDDLGPHKKYQPYVASIEHHEVPMVTADDDVLYPRRWLSSLAEAHALHPDAVLAHRVNRIRVEDGAIRPYAEWGRADDARPTPRNYAVGVKGILYPPRFLDQLRDAGTDFRTQAPGSSDTWLHHMSLRHGVRTLPVFALRTRAVVPMRGGPKASALMDENVDRGRNDRVRAAVLAPDEVAAIVADDFAPQARSTQ